MHVTSMLLIARGSHSSARRIIYNRATRNALQSNILAHIPVRSSRLCLNKTQQQRGFGTTRVTGTAPETAGERIVVGAAGDDSMLIIKLAQRLLESVHDGTLISSLTSLTSEMAAIPWWAAIAGSVFVLRTFLILPVAVYQQRAAARAQMQGRVVMAWSHSMRSSLKLETQDQKLTDEQFEKLLARRINLKHHDLMLRQGCHPVFSMLLPLSQLPVWLSMSYALRHLCGRPGFWDNQGVMFPVADGMLTEGLAWFTDLAVADPTHCLPAVLLLVNMANVMIAQRRMRNGTLLGVLQQESGWIRAITLASYASPWVIACISLFQPTALVYYWTLSATFGLVQNIGFQNRTLRKKLKFPTLPQKKPETT